MLSKRPTRKAWLVGAALMLTWGLYFLNMRILRIQSMKAEANAGLTVGGGGPFEGGDVLDVHGSFVIRTRGCSIPRYPTFSDAVLPYLDTGKPPVDCLDKYRSSEGPKLDGPPIVSNATHVFVAHPYEGHSCCYRTISRRVSKDDHWADNMYGMGESCVQFPSGSALHVSEEALEFTRVKCKVSRDGRSDEFVDTHAVPVPKRNVEKRCAEKSASLSAEERDNRLNLLIIGLDASSRQNFHRQMPRTREFLEELGAVELVGYNKVADNTFPNIVPLMTGLKESELKKLCWRRAYDKLDDCPWLWHRFEERGYRTAMVEDAPNIGIFNFERLGFRKQPSDYYLRPFILATEGALGHFNYPSVLLCLGPRLGLEVVFDYTTKFAQAFFNSSEHPSLAFAWSTTMTHDGLALVREADPVVARELRKSITPAVRDRTALLFISDHGVRTGDFRQTPQGSQEERLPFAFLALPPSFRKKFPRAFENLRTNGGQRLTTPFDLHLTLADLLDPKTSLSPETLERRTLEVNSSSSLPRGISLFLPVPDTRRCEDAGISDHWCTCLTGGAAEKWADGGEGPAIPWEIAENAGKALVGLINGILKRSPEAPGVCAQLRLEEVLEAKTNGDEGGGVMVRIKTSPGGAVFEGTLARKVKWKDKTLDWALGSSGSGEENVGISRLNRYGNQSVCIEDYHLKIFCYCNDQVEVVLTGE